MLNWFATRIATLSLVCVVLLLRTAAAAETKSAEAHKSKLDILTEGMKSQEGLFKVWHNDQRLLALIKHADLDKEYIVLTSIAQGISQGAVIGGMSWGFDDDVLWIFKKVGDNIQVIRRNVRFTANSGTPEAEAVALAYSDSILYSLPVLTESHGGYIVDLGRVFMNDDQFIGRAIGPSFRFVSDRSTWSKVKAFPTNLELQFAAVYSGMQDLQTVIDPRGVQIQIHYSMSRLPSTDYHVRKADDRIGYFLTVLKNFSDKDDDQHFVRYINRWNLKKETSDGALSTPTKPIEFYIEKTVPKKLRPYVAEGILEWNKAFEKLGYYNAIKVHQPGEYDVKGDEPKDPEDIRYNFFRWITAEAGFAMGPSRVNPKTGEILDADIIFDDSFLRYWKQDYEILTPQKAADLFERPIGKRDVHKLFEEPKHSDKHLPNHECAYCRGMQHQMGFAASALMARGLVDDKGKLPEEFIQQALKEVVMHEVGHTLGLRHNFKASTWKDLKQLDDKSKGNNEAIVGSVMDYAPPNISPTEKTQGFYYTPTIGPYDYWAIEYGYKEVSGKESEELGKIAEKCTEPGLQYATDEDTRFFDSDPLSNRFDLGSNPVEFTGRQMKLSSELMPKMLDRAVKKGEGFQRARQAFNKLFEEYWRAARYTARFPGGIVTHRDHKGDPHARPPFQLVDTKQQRDAMKVLSEHVFAPPSYDPSVLNYLTPTHWSHWGMVESIRKDYPIDEYVEMMQSEILFQVLNPITLARLHDNEQKVAATSDRYTMAEHMRSLIEAIFAEWKDAKPATYSEKAPYIAVYRRNLQRMTLKELAYILTSSYSSPEDARTLARMHLQTLNAQINTILQKKDVKLDDYTRAHLLDSQKRIQQVLDAHLEIQSID
jgi:hypothetical protein